MMKGRRQLHTIVSREIIKPSSPTPFHLKTYNLSLLDQLAMNAYMPMVVFHPSSGIYCSSPDKALDLKNSLSQTLTRYYPFAGRLSKTAPTYVNCNDEGVEFVEACIDSPLSDFIQNSEHKSLDQLFPNGLVWYKRHHKDHNAENNYTEPLLAVQVNHFACGGVAVAVSLSHKIADGSSLCNFLNDWATVTRLSSGEQKYILSIEPHFIPFQITDINFQGFSLDRSPASSNCVTRSFVFPNSKLNDLKLKVTAMTMESGKPIMNPTRLDVLTWLLHKCVVAAATKNNSGSFKSTGVGNLMNIRNKMMEPLPATSMGNLHMIMDFPTKNQRDILPEAFIGQLKRLKLELGGLKNIEMALGLVSRMCLGTGIEERQIKIDDYYIYSSLCGYPIYDIDFGWGKPSKVTISGTLRKNGILLMDTPNRDGIEAQLTLDKQDMKIVQNDPELLAFC